MSREKATVRKEGETALMANFRPEKNWTTKKNTTDGQENDRAVENGQGQASRMNGPAAKGRLMLMS